MTAIDLGSIIAGKPSKLQINAIAPDGSNLYLRLKRNKDAGELPQGLRLMQDGAIVGKTTFRNTTSFDKGTTTFSVTDSKLETITTWDSSFTFTAEAYSAIGPLLSISIIDGGSGYTSAPDVTITGGGGIQATATCTISGGAVNTITITNEGEGFTHQPTITFTGGGGSGAIAVADIPGQFGISSFQDYKITVKAYAAKPWQDVYCVALPHLKDRTNWEYFTSDFNVFDQEVLYRKNDERFGLQRDIRILVKSGLNPKYLKDYLTQMEAYHYTKTLRFGDLKSARSYVNGKVEYEVIYYEIEEVNASEETVIDLSSTNFDFAPVYSSSGKVRASLGTGPGVSDYTVDMTTWDPAYDVYPNSFKNMRNRLTVQLGEVVSEAKSLPSWMSTEQENGGILQYTSAVPLVYVKPGNAERIKFLIKRSKFNPNNFLFKVDRYEWDKDLSESYDIDNDKYATRLYTTYDTSSTTFDDDDMKYLDVIQNLTGNGTEATRVLTYYVNRSDEIAVTAPLFSGNISGVTQANPAVVTTSADHNLTSGDKIKIVNVSGMTELNGNEYYANVITSTTFSLYSDSGLTTTVDSSAYTAYTSNGNFATTANKILTPVKDYVAQFRSITFNSIPINNINYDIIYKEYAPITYHKVGEKDKYIKFPQTGVYE